jgi:Domain of unknown function (DUF4259)
MCRTRSPSERGAIAPVTRHDSVMGAWGTGPFDNDDVLDWEPEWDDADDLIPARLAVMEAVLSDEYLEAPEASRAVAAAEIIAASRGVGSAALPDGVAAWLSAHPGAADADDADAAVRAIDRVLADRSELKELWDEAGDPGWAEGLKDIRNRLTQSFS